MKIGTAMKVFLDGFEISRKVTRSIGDWTMLRAPGNPLVSPTHSYTLLYEVGLKIYFPFHLDSK